MKLWVDDLRKPPKGYRWAKSVNEAKKMIIDYETMYLASGKKDFYKIEVINLDHDAGDYVNDGGDYIKLLCWLERTGRNYPIHIHTANVVGRMNMEAIIKYNGWEEV